MERRNKRRIVIGSAIGLTMVAGIAFAAYLLTLAVGGNLGPGARAAWQFEQAKVGTQEPATCSGGTGQVTYVNGASTINIAQSQQFPGDNCAYGVYVQAKPLTANTGDLKLVGIKPDGGTMPSGWTLVQESACGKVIPKASAAGQFGDPTIIQFRLETSGTDVAVPFNATIEAVPASQWKSQMCPAGAPVQ